MQMGLKLTSTRSTAFARIAPRLFILKCVYPDGTLFV